MNSTIYCPIPTCHSFIPPHAITSTTGTCPTCHTRICTLCRLPPHPPTAHCHPPTTTHAKATQAADETLTKKAIQQRESEEQKFISRLIRENAKAERNIPSGLGPEVKKKYKEDLRARHWMLCEEAWGLFERMVKETREYEVELEGRMELD